MVIIGAWLVDQAVPLGCCLVAEHGTRPGAEQARAQSTVSRVGSPEKVAYTPRCSRCQWPLRALLRMVCGSMPAAAL